MVLFIIFFTLLFLPPIIFAQPVMRFERITCQDGLPSGTILNFLQDYQGFLWFTTMNGPIKYDGFKFTTFVFDKYDTNTIRGYDAMALYEDKSRNLWIGTIGVLSRYKREMDIFENYFLNIDDKSNIPYVRCICEDDSSYLYLGTSNCGFFRFDRRNGIFKNYRNNSHDETSISNNWIYDLCPDENQIIWIATGHGLNKFDIINQTFKSYEHIPGNKKSLSSNYTQCVFKDKSGTLWVGTTNGLNKFDKSTGSFESFGIEDDSSGLLNNIYIRDIYENQDGNLWLATDNGLIIFDKEKFSFYKYSHEYKIPFTLSGNNVSVVFKDRSGIIWVGTRRKGGINKYNREHSKFIYYRNYENDRKSLTGGSVTSIIEDRTGTIWVGTTQGLNKLNDKNKEFTKFIKVPGKKNAPSSNTILSLFEDSKGIFWIGTDNGLTRFDKETGVFTNYLHYEWNKEISTKFAIRAIYEDKLGNLWLGTPEGIEKFDRELNTFTHYESAYGDTYKLNKDILCFYEDKSGDLWAGASYRGLNKFDREKGIFTSYYYSDLSTNAINGIIEDRKNRFWCVSSQNGLYLFDRDKGDFQLTFGMKNGLSSNSAVSVVGDDRGYLWIGTQNGLSKYDPETGKSRNYDLKDGIPIVNVEASLKDRNGYLYFGGEEGYLKFHPDSLQENTNPPSVVLTDFKIFNQSVKPSDNGLLKKNINVAEEIELTYKENVFSIEFAALDYHNPMKNRYAYMLEGFNEDWVYTDASSRTAHYTNIDPGEYVFRVKGSNNDGVWNEEGTSVKIIITPPWWQTWWFRGCFILLILGVLEFTRERHMTKVRKEIMQKEEFSRQLISNQEQERKRIASDLHDSHVQNLLLLKNKISMLMRRKDTTGPEKEELRDISDGLLSSMDEIRSISYSLRPHEIERFGLTDSIGHMIEKVGETSGVIFKTQIENINGLLKQDDEVILYRIVQECLNNIVKHSQAKTAKIRISKYSDSIEIFIKDDGIGFDIEKLGRQTKLGLGLTDIRERVSLLKGEIDIITSPGNGTSIEINIPYTIFSNEQEIKNINR